ELGCPRGTRPVWGDLNWSVETAPTAGYEDTSVTFLITTATVEADLTTSTPVALPVPPTSPPVNVDAVLAGAGLPRNNPFLGVAAVLRSNPAMTRTPVLHEFGVEFRCVPTE
ncbi:MAG: hypothetical protein KC586_06960, partial [Myxococcales bacterium]|nr:hypothetical protein [Myxococcales bacterium]